MKPTNNIGFLLQHLSFTLARQSDQILQERLGIGFSQFKLLMVLQWKPGVQQKYIADKLGQTEASVSRQIKLMFDEGLLQTSPRPGDRREHITTLTKRGVRITEQAMEVLNEYHQPMFNHLSAHQREELLKTLSIMHDYACREGANGSCKQ